MRVPQTRDAPLLEVVAARRDYPLPRTEPFAPHPRLRAVDDVSFTLHEGESLGLVGELGCGKSTLTRAILGLDALQGGAIRLRGAPVSPAMPNARRVGMQVVFQDPYGSFNPRHRVDRLVAEPFHLMKTPPADRADRVAETLAAVGLGPEAAGKYIHEFSGGQRQRIAIARALVIRPESDRAGRGGLGARRAGPGADPRPSGGLAGALWSGLPFHQPRPVGGARDHRQGHGDAGRQDRGRGEDRGTSSPRPPIPIRGRCWPPRRGYRRAGSGRKTVLPELWFDPAQLFIGGRWRPATARLTLEDPSTGAAIGEIARGGAAEIDAAVAAAEASLAGPWGRATAAERGRVLARIGALVLARADDLAALEAADVGKPLRQARADVLALARYMEFYGGAADKVMGETIPYLDGYTVYTLREPHGVTGHIVPWNYPMQIIGRSVGAALAMGNACVLKPAEEACLTALAFAHLAAEAGLPAGALNVVPGLGEEAGAALAAHPGVRHLSFTGSVGVGCQVQAAAARNVVPVTLELGGKSPQLVFADADLDAALPFLVNAGIQNAGQTCSASSRILVERARYDEVVGRMAERYAALRVGPARSDLDVGPLISARQKAVVEGLLALAGDAAVAARGQIVAEAPAGGHYVAPMLLAGLGPDHRLAQDEIFGPAQVVHALRRRG